MSRTSCTALSSVSSVGALTSTRPAGPSTTCAAFEQVLSHAYAWRVQVDLLVTALHGHEMSLCGQVCKVMVIRTRSFQGGLQSPNELHPDAEVSSNRPDVFGAPSLALALHAPEPRQKLPHLGYTTQGLADIASLQPIWLTLNPKGRCRRPSPGPAQRRTRA